MKLDGSVPTLPGKRRWWNADRRAHPARMRCRSNAERLHDASVGVPLSFYLAKRTAQNETKAPPLLSSPPPLRASPSWRRPRTRFARALRQRERLFTATAGSFCLMRKQFPGCAGPRLLRRRGNALYDRSELQKNRKTWPPRPARTAQTTFRATASFARNAARRRRCPAPPAAMPMPPARAFARNAARSFRQHPPARQRPRPPLRPFPKRHRPRVRPMSPNAARSR